MIRRILVPLDGSVRAEGILPHLLVLARAFGARLDLLHVIPSSRSNGEGENGPADPFGSRMARVHWTRYLEGKAEELRASGVEVWTRVEEGAPSSEIVDLLRRGEYDLVGLTTHGAGNDRSLRIGCTAAAVILNSGSGVLLAPARGQRGGRGEVVPYRHILAPVDCSPRSDWSLGIAAGIARGADAALRVVHVLDCPEVVSRLPGRGGAAGFVDRIRDLNRAEARRYLEEATWRFQAQGVEVDTEVVETGATPAEALLDLASARDVDLVVLSAHGRGASTAWPLGGTATKLALWAQRPLLVLQDQPAERFRAERATRASRTAAGES